MAKRGFVEWDSWDIYDKPDDPVDVRYVWDANYDGIAFPEKETAVFKVKTASAARSTGGRRRSTTTRAPSGARIGSCADVEGARR